MKKVAYMMFIALILLLAGCGTGSNESGDSGSSSGGKKLKVVTNAAYAPMEYLEGDKVLGFDVDFINAVAEEAGYEVEVKHTGWEAMFVEIEQGLADLAVAAITISNERKQTYDFTVPYYESSNMILVKEGSDIKGVADLKDKKIGVQNGTTGHFAAEKILGEKNEKIKSFEDINLAIQELINNGVDAVIADKPVLENYVKNNQKQGLKLIDDPENFEAEYFGILFPKNSEIKDDFDAAVKTLFDNGKYAEIYKQWFGVEPDIDSLKALQ